MKVESMTRQRMPISRWWFQGAVLTYLVGFTVLGILAYLTYAEQPPIPRAAQTKSGEVLFTRSDILQGMEVFRRYGLMEYGSIYGHGAYLGTDFTADYLHRSAEIVRESGTPQVTSEFHENTYDPENEIVTWSNPRGKAHSELIRHYTDVFSNSVPSHGIQAHLISNTDEIRKLVAFFGWTA